jgi:hypothetical protein
MLVKCSDEPPNLNLGYGLRMQHDCWNPSSSDGLCPLSCVFQSCQCVYAGYINHGVALRVGPSITGVRPCTGGECRREDVATIAPSIIAGLESDGTLRRCLGRQARIGSVAFDGYQCRPQDHTSVGPFATPAQFTGGTVNQPREAGLASCEVGRQQTSYPPIPSVQGYNTSGMPWAL